MLSARISFSWAMSSMAALTPREDTTVTSGPKAVLPNVWSP
jgi:hypothetical protein